MHVKLETACFWGEGNSRKRYEAGSVIDVPAEVAEKNSFMKPTDDPLTEKASKDDSKKHGDK